MADFMDAIGKFDDDEDLENFNHVQHILFNSPAIVYLALPKDYTGYSLYDLGGFGMSLMLAATELGIDSIPAYELIKYPYILRDNLPIPEMRILSWELHLDTNPKSISMNMSLLDLIWMRF